MAGGKKRFLYAWCEQAAKVWKSGNVEGVVFCGLRWTVDGLRLTAYGGRFAGDGLLGTCLLLLKFKDYDDQ